MSVTFGFTNHGYDDNGQPHQPRLRLLLLDAENLLNSATVSSAITAFAHNGGVCATP